MDRFQLEEYLSKGVENIVSEILKATLHNPKETLFLTKYAVDSRNARKIRQQSEAAGEHIPPFLIASITTMCNLHCKGCYARANHNCCDDAEKQSMLLSAEKWGELFTQAEELGIGFILLAGGEPFLRTDVLREAAKHRKILFPVFTNGTMFSETAMELLDQNRNLIPVLSIEGNREKTDLRRGQGTYERLVDSMDKLQKKSILFAASVTVTTENITEVFSEEFIHSLADRGCKGIIYVEYVPVDASTQSLAINDDTREYMMEQLDQLRQQRDDMVFIAFPGDEKSSGGCLAAGRGFFHINAVGGAEPCPFSPYSDVNVKDVTLQEALQSPLFRKLRDSGALTKEHIGGCVLFEQESEVRELVQA